MGLFSRRRPSAAVRQNEAIDAFWAWWQAEGAATTATAIDTGHAVDVADQISRRVEAIDPQLGWELGPGRSAQHVLMVTAEGVPEQRAAARRWRREAPAADDVWEYSDLRLPAPDLAEVSLSLGGVTVPAVEVEVSARVDGARIDVGLYHSALAGLDEQDRLRATFLLLDQALGELDVELWIGAVQALTLRPLDPIPLPTLSAVVDQVRDRWQGPDGGVGWALATGTTPGGLPVMVTAQVPLNSATAPHLDTYVGVEVPFVDRTDVGLPGDGSLEPLRRFEEHLVDRLADSGRLVAHQTSDGTRILHLYVDGTTPAAEQVKAAVGGWAQGTPRVHVRPDPGWQEMRPLRF